MNITLPREQQEWLEAQVRAGTYESIDEAVAGVVATRMLFELDGRIWAKPIVDDARASIARGEVATLAEYHAKMNQRLGKREH